MKVLDEAQATEAYRKGLHDAYWSVLSGAWPLGAPERRGTFDRGLYDGDRLRQRHERWVARQASPGPGDRSEFLQAANNIARIVGLRHPPEPPVDPEVEARAVERILRKALGLRPKPTRWRRNLPKGPT
jgi:hypothetical protein